MDLFIATILTAALHGPMAGGPAIWSFSASTRHMGQVDIEMKAVIEKGWHMYATVLPSDQGPVPTSFRFEPSDAYVANGGVREPVPVEEYDDNFGMVVRHHSGEPTFVLPIDVKSNEPFIVKGEVEYMLCNDRTCLPPTVVPFEIDVKPTAK